MADEILLDLDAYPQKARSTVSITMNRPDKHNAADEAMLDGMIGALETVSRSDASFLLLRGAGNDFSAGRDTSPGSSHSPLKEILGKIIRINTLLQEMPQITIAEIRGKALGVGCGLALLSDISVASSSSVLGFPEMSHNLPPTIVASYLPKWIPRKKAFELIVAGREITSEEAEQLFIVNESVADNELEGRVAWWLSNLSAKSPSALKMCKTFIRSTRNMTVDDSTTYGLTALVEWSIHK